MRRFLRGSGGIEVDVMFRDHDGNLVSGFEAYGKIPPGDPTFSDAYDVVSVGRPPGDASLAVGRSLALHLALTGLLLGATVMVTTKRRPY